MKTWIRIWWAHRERWNASACSVLAQCKQPVHVCACLPPLKLLSISLWCPFLLIQTFVPPATTDAVPPQDFIHKHSIRIPCLQPAPLWSSCPHHHVVKKVVWAVGEVYACEMKLYQKIFFCTVTFPDWRRNSPEYICFSSWVSVSYLITIFSVGKNKWKNILFPKIKLMI